MASEEDVTSDSLDVKVTKVPESLQEYVKTRVAEYIAKSKEMFMEIHKVEGQNAKLVLTCGTVSGNKAHVRPGNETNNEATRTILVRNLPASVDQDLLEIFFESKKKYGGGPVESVTIYEERHAALVKFCDEGSVKTVLEKKPIMYGKAELIVEPFKELITESETIAQMDIKGISKTFTDDLLKKYFDCIVPLTGLTGPELAAMIKIGSRVVRGKDWKWGDQDGGGVGTVDKINKDSTVFVRWDKSGLSVKYRMGSDDCYDLQMAP